MESIDKTATKAAWVYNTSGPVRDVLKLDKEFPSETSEDFKPDDILVDVVAMSINPIDYKLMQTYKMLLKLMFKFPVIPGLDFAGKIVATGPDVRGLKVGDHVWGKQAVARYRSQGGTLTTRILTDTKCVYPLPDSISFNDAAGFGVAGITAWEGLVEAMHVKPGQRVVILGGSGGVGTFAIQIAKALGVEVTSISSTTNLQLCKSLGATHTIDYKSEDVVARLGETGPYDYVFDLINDNGLYNASSKFLKPDGAFYGIAGDVSLGYMGSAISRKLRPKVLGGSSHAYHNYLLKAEPKTIKEFAEFVSENGIKTVTDSLYNFDHALAAFDRLTSHRAKGKIIVKMD
ncbi:mitochondrial CH-OH group oxidoreductase [Schizosaccharomyces osmophilus]|uniref:Mitochondrial CH-OH group oxidoreductase n=1 Tax=Schizosaccharomyces osmophilus TaxID=2545709 RepID=A0AAE9WCL9_9SCHI|nr:mitochondrial CH-OH group oxidoreductase [Schizosaccharomyces osmophilus]WBW73405.1 mitochondrial CH-OH group oxidoreductase [Schizosaccharomyces osmophilus]